MIYAGILAGGKGTRMGVQDLPKQFLDLGNRPILIHTIEKFLLVNEIEEVVVGVHPDWVTYAEDLINKYLDGSKDRIRIVPGGADRNMTIEQIIRAIESVHSLTEDDVIITHDSVRPFISFRSIQENITKIETSDAVDTVVEATDTIVQSMDKEIISQIPERQYLYQGQTPQTFRMKSFLSLYEELTNSEREQLTDACKIFVLKGKKVSLAQGDYSNIKITTVVDLKIARSMIEDN
ncbi:2-C-methyl-D-erythritol 4-phosphate cytidylyltransferase [Streptococcus sp. 121]|uniref:IspD/TarI family cytidylyltransferase n=1 Tax=Streptococcus sp. 121 TaxID=2797637 RepID=UPI0018F07C79|nr:2-C-methyl-D-erythritol 4-phosphate cytidylyltransferase [Streptococcus sp. 121]MBJ6746083.1 2-C-methyl-D-erythritol 4-phosphate cytidylyltransferase [Streptococcus sp. 121]